MKLSDGYRTEKYVVEGRINEYIAKSDAMGYSKSKRRRMAA